MKKAFFLFLAFSLSSCSIYQSTGRKYLEQQGFDLAKNSVAQNFDYCGNDQHPDQWSNWMTDERAVVAVTGELKMRVSAHGDPNQSCYFHFASEQEMHDKTDAAIVVTLHLSPAQCVGQFAFQASCNLK